MFQGHFGMKIYFGMHWLLVGGRLFQVSRCSVGEIRCDVRLRGWGGTTSTHILSVQSSQARCECAPWRVNQLLLRVRSAQIHVRNSTDPTLALPRLQTKPCVPREKWERDAPAVKLKPVKCSILARGSYASLTPNDFCFVFLNGRE